MNMLFKHLLIGKKVLYSQYCFAVIDRNRFFSYLKILLLHINFRCNKCVYKNLRNIRLFKLFDRQSSLICLVKAIRELNELVSTNIVFRRSDTLWELRILRVVRDHTNLN